MWTRRTMIACLSAGVLLAADAPPSADSILEAAKTQAEHGRAIFAIFHASW